MISRSGQSWLALLLPAFLPGRARRQIAASFANRFLHGSTARMRGYAGKAGFEVPFRRDARMCFGGNGALFQPGTQFFSSEQSFAQFLMLFGKVDHLFRQLLVVCQQEVQEESTRLGQDGGGLLQSRPFLCVGSPAGPRREVQLKNCTTRYFAHQAALSSCSDFETSIGSAFLRRGLVWARWAIVCTT